MWRGIRGEAAVSGKVWRLAMIRRVSIGLLLCATAAIALIDMSDMSVVAPALAQNRPTQAIAADELFAGPESPDFRGGVGVGVDRLVNVVKQAQQPGSQCPTDVDFTVIGGPHPDGPVVSQALAAARRDAIEAVLRGFGPTVRITAKSTSGIVSMVFISAQAPKDKEPPKLDTNSVPRKGTKVKAGDQIKVTMVARDDANAWQTGIKTIQLVAESEGGRFIASQNYLPEAQCPVQPVPRRVEATYVVPANPPPIVRLAALAEDHAGLMDTDVGEFPTEGDWYGSLELSAITPAYSNHALLDVTLNYDRRRGNLTGQIWAGEVTAKKPSGIPCAFSVASKATLSANLVGQYTPGTNTMSLTMRDEKTVLGSTVCPPVPGGSPYGHGLIDRPVLAQLLRGLTTKADGSVDETREDSTVPQNTVTVTLKLHRTRN
jgi:hypothetical protein